MSKIISISEAVSIALHGMVLIKKSDHTINVKDIADTTNSSRHHVAKVMQRLVKAGYLSSQRGPTGGFQLKESPEKISLLDIWETVEGHIEITECPIDKPSCPFDDCLFEDVTQELSGKFRDFLEKKKLDMY